MKTQNRTFSRTKTFAKLNTATNWFTFSTSEKINEVEAGLAMTVRDAVNYLKRLGFLVVNSNEHLVSEFLNRQKTFLRRYLAMKEKQLS